MQCLYLLVPCSTQARRVAWHKATSDQIDTYQSCVRESYKQFIIPDHVLSCSDLHCKVHWEYLSTLCQYLVCCLVSCAEATITLTSHRKWVAGWKDDLRRGLCFGIGYGMRVDVLRRVHVLFQLRKHTKAWYKYAVRRVMRKIS